MSPYSYNSVQARPLRTGIIGFGRVAAEDHVPAYQVAGGFEVAAVADASPAGRRAARDGIRKARVYASHQEMLAAESLDLVDICTPPSFHTAQAVDALNAGVAVLCEKPVASGSSELARLIKAAQKRALLFPCHNWRFSPGIRLARRLIARGVIGQPRRLYIEIRRSAPAQGSPHWKPGWRLEQGIAGGGVWMDHGPHIVYLCEDLLGGPVEAVSLQASGQRYPRQAVESTVRATLSVGAAEAIVSLDWGAHDRLTRYQIVGSIGKIDIAEQSMSCRVNNAQPRQFANPWPLGRPGSRQIWYAHLFQQLRAAMASASVKEQWLLEIGRIAHAMETGYRSAAQGGEVLTVPAYSLARALVSSS